MVAGNVTLTVVGGAHSGQKFTFRERARYVVGRAHDCPVRLCGILEDCFLSRHHCLLEVAAQALRVWDLRSWPARCQVGLTWGEYRMSR